MSDFTMIEEMVLLAVWKLSENAYGVTIRKHLSEKTGRIFPYGTLYSALAKLEGRGFVAKRISDPTPERGGRSKNYYTITHDGLESLRSAMEMKRALWDKETEIALTKG